MKALMLAGAMIVATGTASFADGLYWVVGNRATSKCDIVTSNPVINVTRRYLVRGRSLQFPRRRQARPLDHPRLPEEGSLRRRRRVVTRTGCGEKTRQAGIAARNRASQERAAA